MTEDGDAHVHVEGRRDLLGQLGSRAADADRALSVGAYRLGRRPRRRARPLRNDDEREQAADGRC